VLLNGGDGHGIDLLSEARHGDCELHVEFNVAKGSNSGIYFQGQYSAGLRQFRQEGFGLKYGDNGGIYTPPRRRPTPAPPGTWQTFDVPSAPRASTRRKKTENAKFVKVVHNGTVIHEGVEVKGPTTPRWAAGEGEGPLCCKRPRPVAYRNLRLKPLALNRPSRPDGGEAHVVHRAAFVRR